MEDTTYKSVLLIDDSYIDNLINQKILEVNHFAGSITVMDSPLLAIDYLTERFKSNTVPEIIFLDIRMPEMNGFEFIHELNKIKQPFSSEIKIYVLSSSLDPNDLKKVENSELVVKFISKPLTARALEEIKNDISC